MKIVTFAAAQLLLLLLLGACSEAIPITPVPAIDPEQQILFYNGTVLTMDPEMPEGTALAVQGEKISAVGSDTEILALEEPGARLVDLQGATLMPGFVDAHSHLFNDSEQYFDRSLLEMQQLALENGITSLGDLFVEKGFVKDMREFDDQGGLQIRTSLYLVATDNCGKSKGDWWLEYPATDEPGEMLRTGGIKIFTDGGTCERPALSYELTPGEGLGDLFHSQEELDELVGQAHAAGRQVAIHAIGDRAVEQAQKAIEAALGGEPNTLRHRIEHNAVVRPELLARYGEIGIVPVLFGLYPICEPFGPPPPELYQSWEWPTRALLDANPGLPVAWHGDDPWSERVRPLDDLYSFLTRDGVGSDGAICPAPAWQKQHVITAEEALSMMTINAAYALFRDDEVGSLEPGKYADLIVLSDNPLAVAPEEIPGMAVWMTMVGGRTAFCMVGQEAVCPDSKGRTG
jgi:predicted amidohydrolase YtcJ